jgi:hypothetical protein
MTEVMHFTAEDLEAYLLRIEHELQPISAQRMREIAQEAGFGRMTRIFQ